MYPLKQSAAITIPVFVHDVNGDAVTGLVDGGFTKRISKNGAAFAAMTVTITEQENGWYTLPLSAAHTDTLGAAPRSFPNHDTGNISEGIPRRPGARCHDRCARENNSSGGRHRSRDPGEFEDYRRELHRNPGNTAVLDLDVLVGAGVP